MEHLLTSCFMWSVPPVISSRGGTVTVLVNEPARLACEATGVPLPSFTWLKDGSPVASVLPGLQVLLNSSLAQMRWTFLPLHMIIVCTWENLQLWFVSRWQVLSEGRVLSLNSALVTDTGTYTCVAVNAGGEQQREYDLRVYGESITSCFSPAPLFSLSVTCL